MSKKTKVLVVVDMQNDFLTGCLGNEQTQNIQSAVIKKIHNFQGLVIFTRDTHENNYFETQEGKRLPVSHCIKDTEGWEIPLEIFNAAIKPEGMKDIMFVDKPSFGMSHDNIERVKEYLNDFEIESIELIGVCTDICVISNAMILKSLYPEVPMRVDANCCAGVTPESHENALKAMSACQIDIILGW